MRLLRAGWLLGLLCLGSCFGPLRCESSAPPVDEGAPLFYDLAIGELGRAPGNACTSIDNCNRAVADTCNGHCQCGTAYAGHLLLHAELDLLSAVAVLLPQRLL